MKQLLEFLINSRSTGIIQDNNFIDLGLSVLWAKCNIGAKEPEDIGNYYQWGGLEPMNNKSCEWKTCPFNNGKDNFDEKYFKSIKEKICSNAKLYEKYDIAYQTYGDNSHMPSPEQCAELLQNTGHEQFTINNINGVRFIGKNNNSIFIPYSGYRNENRWFDENYSFYLWTNTLYINIYNKDTLSCAKSFYLSEDEDILIDNDFRCLGYNIRAVKDI